MKSQHAPKHDTLCTILLTLGVLCAIIPPMMPVIGPGEWLIMLVVSPILLYFGYTLDKNRSETGEQNADTQSTDAQRRSGMAR